MRLKMHDELISMEIPQKMLELSAIAFSPMKSINISMKRKFSSNGHHYRPHLTSASSDISNEETTHHSNIDDCDVVEEDDDSRASSTLVGNGELVKTDSKLANDINLPSPPSSTRSSFDNDGVTRDSFTSNGDTSDNVADVSSQFGSFSSPLHHHHHNNNDSDVILEGQSEQSLDGPQMADARGRQEKDNNEVEPLDDDIKLITETLVNKVAEEAEEPDSAYLADEHDGGDHKAAEPSSSPAQTNGSDHGSGTNTIARPDIEERWKGIQIDFEGETTLPNGLRLIKGVAEMPFCRDFESDKPRFTNQLNFLKTMLTKYIFRYKTAMPFLNPVDSVRFKIPHYYLVIRQPMDLSTVKNRINFLWYHSADECISDLRLIFSNCYQFNSPTDYVYKSGKKLEEYLDDKLKDMPHVETEIPCPPRPSVEEYQKLNAKQSPVKARTGSISEHSENGECIGYSAFGPIKMTTRSERGVMVRKPSKDLPAPISTPQPKQPSTRKVPLNEPMKYCLEFVKELFSKKHADYAWPFWEPVNPTEYPDYAQKIKRPVDLSSIKTNIESGKYSTINDFASDMRLMFSNCLRYNTPESPIIEQARKLREQFEYKVARVPDEWLQEKLVVHHTSNSRTTSPSVRFSASASSSSSKQLQHHNSVDSHKKQKISIKSHGENKKSSKGRNSVDNSLNLALFNSPSTSADVGQSRMAQLERQVASLTNALHACLVYGNNGAVPPGAGGVLMNAMMSTTTSPVTVAPVHNGTAPSRGRPRKNGMPAQARNNGTGSNVKKASKKQANSRKRKHHLSSDEDSDSDQEMGQVAEPFAPDDIEDLKKLKNDLENLRAKDLQNVLRILQSTEPSLRCDDESNVEIDFEALQPKTLIALRKYVTSCMLNNKSSPVNHHHSASTSQSAPAAKSGSASSTTTNNHKKLCQSSNSRSTSILDTDCDNPTINNWSRAGSRASDLQLSESSSSDSELDD